MTFTKGMRDEGQVVERNGVEFTIPTSRNVKMRTYDRLRKASYRRMERYYAVTDADYWKQYDHWNAQKHAAYIAGVRDALNG